MEVGVEQLRYLLVKFDGESFNKVQETVDYGDTLKGGSIVARLDYSVIEKLVTIEHWEVFWRDEWPLRLAAQFLTNCMYPSRNGYIIRVDSNTFPFWVSEKFVPISSSPSEYLIENGNP